MEQPKSEEDEIKGQKLIRKFRDILMLLFKRFPRPFSTKDVCHRIKRKGRNALRSKRKAQQSTSIYQYGKCYTVATLKKLRQRCGYLFS